MSLNDYVLNGPSVVIEDDDRDPYVSWRHHLERTQGLRGGVDLVALTPQLVYAPTDGWMDHWPNDGSAGNSCRFRHAKNEGWADVFSHLSAYTVPHGAFVRQGQPVAWSGSSGGVAPHLHRHLLDPQGVRRNPWDYFSSATAAGVVNPLDELGATMYSFIPDAQSDTIFAASLTNGERVGIQSPYHMELLQRFRKNGGGDEMLVVEMDICRTYLKALEDDSDTDAILAELRRVAVTPAAIREAMQAVVQEGITVTAEVSDDQLDAAADRFAKLLGVRIAGGQLGYAPEQS